MSYLVLARKWRPRRFDEMVGQEHVRRALVNALSQQRLHHAYLFTGTRGVGKTTVARIFAKCLNCESGISAEPCGSCSACSSIDAGRFLDLIEIDAASRTKVEDTRDLLENVQYAPTGGRFKVYLIDEVHMLSTHSFNALLKTLEEPPPHTKFLLATTDPQKLPATVLSRCLQFNLKPLPSALIAEQLTRIAEQEQVAAEPGALGEISAAARGSMRDALSLLDQAIGHGGGQVTESEVTSMLGSIAAERLVELLQAMAARRTEQVLRLIGEMAAVGTDMEAMLAGLLSLLHRLALAQSVPAALGPDAEPGLGELLEVLHPADVQLWYQIGLLGRRDLPYAPDPRSGVEMTLLRMLVFRPPAPLQAPAASAPPAAARSPGPPGATGAGALGAAPSPAAGRAQEEPSAPPVPPAEAPPAPTDQAPAATSDPDWSAIVASLPVGGLAQQLAVNSELVEVDGDRWQLRLAPAHANLNTPTFVERLRQALSQHCGRSLKLVVEVAQPAGETPAAAEARHQAERLDAARQALGEDPLVQSLQNALGAELDESTIRPPAK